MHNRNIINFENAYNLYMCTKALADVVIPQEYGLTKEEKLKIAQGIVTPLLKKIRADLKSNLTGIWNCEDQIINQLDPSYSKGIHSPGRHVRTRLYFTSESHIYSLLTVLKFGNLFEDDQDEQWKNALNYLNTVPELNYLTQIVIMLYEDPSVDADSDKRFHVELHFSPGAYADFDVPKYLSKTNLTPDIEASSNEDFMYNSSGSEGFSPQISTSPKQRLIIPHNSSSCSCNKQDKRSPLSNLVKKIPIKFFSKELQTLPEPSDTCGSFEAKQEIKDISTQSESKPRSFEDEHHQTRIQIHKGRGKSKEGYNHYNTFHGSGSYNYLSLGQVFKNKILNQGTNSSPDLNQNKIGKPKRSFPSKTIFLKRIFIYYDFKNKYIALETILGRTRTLYNTVCTVRVRIRPEI